MFSSRYNKLELTRFSVVEKRKEGLTTKKDYADDHRTPQVQKPGGMRNVFSKEKNSVKKAAFCIAF